MSLLRTILHDLALVILVVAGALGCAVLYKAMHTVDAVNATLAAVSAPCTGFHGSVTCGPIAQMSQAEKNIGILAAQGALQVKQSGALITATTQNMDKVTNSVAGEISALQGTTAALTTTAQTATTSLQTITDGLTPILSSTNTTIAQAGITIEGFQPVETVATKSLTDADLVVRGFVPIESNAATVSSNLGQTTTDFQLKFHAFLFPAPCKTFGCRLARTWPYVKGASQMVEPLYWGQQLFENRVP